MGKKVKKDEKGPPDDVVSYLVVYRIMYIYGAVSLLGVGRCG